MGKRKGKHSILASLLLTTVLLPPVPAVTASEIQLEEIVVTARKREERLQEVPESVTVFSAAQIEQAGIESVRDFVDMTPNLIIRETFRSNETFLTMRGLAGAQGALPPVSIIVDGVQLGSNDFLTQDLIDVAQIEVLKGPQGALYGQGAIAGAINITTKRPTNETEGQVKASYGRGNTYRLSGVVSGPIVEDRLFVRASAYHRSTDGLIHNARGDRIDFSDQTSGRLQFVYQGEKLRAQMRGAWTEGDGSCCIQDIAPRDAAGNFAGIDDIVDGLATSNIIGRDSTRFRDASLRLDYDMGAVSLISVSGFADVEQWIFADADYSAAPLRVQDITFATKVMNQELRLASNGKGVFNWIVGGFYQDKQENQAIQVGAEIPGGINPNLLNQLNRINSESWALFGQGEYEVTEELTLLAALRYDRDKQDSRDRRAPAASFKQATFKKLQPKLQVSYKWSPDVMTYVTYSEGFRTGGFTQNTKFDNETTRNYEVGFKTTLMDGLMTLNGSVFHIDYSNQLLSFVIFSATESRRGVLNIKSTDIDGFELELNARLTDALSVNAGIGVTDSTVAAIDTTELGAATAVGKKSPTVPPFTFNASATYTQPLTADMDLIAFGSYQRRGAFYFDLNNTMRTGTKSFIDARLSVDASDWAVALVGKNLTDSRHATNLSITGSDLRFPNQPRSYGVEATFRF
ncbi:TonB-dependent receptor [Niveispirillum fermenti]|uniref:TonB-dependent receptor n=1 Tax=Niveispirillum fermenti TaxID=1233113 RepID=UPI003A8C52A7